MFLTWHCSVSVVLVYICSREGKQTRYKCVGEIERMRLDGKVSIKHIRVNLMHEEERTSGSVCNIKNLKLHYSYKSHTDTEHAHIHSKKHKTQMDREQV